MSKTYSSFFKPDIIFLILLALYPLFLGGNRPFPQYFFGSLFGLNCLWTLSRYSSDIFQFKPLRIAIYGALFLLFATLLNALFVSPNMSFAVSGWGLYLSYFMIFLQSLILASRKGFFKKLVKFIAFAGFIYSAYGLLIMGLKSETILFYHKTNYIGSLTSTFINRNHFALFAIFSFLALMILFVQKIKKAEIFETTKLSIMSVRFLGLLTGDGLFIVIQMGIVLAAILLTESRSGLLLVIIGTMIMMLGFMFKNRDALSYKKVSLIIACTLLLFSVFFSGFSAKTADRFHYVGSSMGERMSVWETTFDMIQDKPWFGHGYKNFEYGFNHYRGIDVPLKKRWDKAHNDYLEFIAEFGVVIALFLFIFIIWICQYIIKLMYQNRRLYNDNLFVFSVICVIALHSFVDFGIQMPANGTLLAALLSGAFARSIRSN